LIKNKNIDIIMPSRKRGKMKNIIYLVIMLSVSFTDLISQELTVNGNVSGIFGNATSPVFKDNYSYKNKNWNDYLYGFNLEYGPRTLPVNFGIQASFQDRKVLQQITETTYTSHQIEMKMYVVDLTCDYEKLIFNNVAIRGGIVVSGVSATFYSIGYVLGIKSTSNKEIVNLLTPGFTAGVTYTIDEHILIKLAVVGRFSMPKYEYILASLIYPPTWEPTNYYEKAIISNFQPILSIGYIFKAKH